MKIYKSLFLSFFLFSCDGFNEEIVPININVEEVLDLEYVDDIFDLVNEKTKNK